MKNFLLIDWLKKYHNKYLVVQPQKEITNTKIMQYDILRPTGIIAYSIQTIIDECEEIEDLPSYLQCTKKDKFFSIVEPIGNKIDLRDNTKLKSIWYDGTSNYDYMIKKFNVYKLTKIQAKETHSDWNTILQKCDIDYIPNTSLFDCLFTKDAILFLKPQAINKITSILI